MGRRDGAWLSSTSAEEDRSNSVPAQDPRAKPRQSVRLWRALLVLRARPLR